MGYKETGIIEVICKAADASKIVYRNKIEMQNYQIFPSSELVSYCSGNEETREFDVKVLKKIEASEPLNEEEKEKEQEYMKYEFKLEMKEPNPEMIYTDVTETEMLGFPEISKNVLTSQDNGLWAYHGLRKLKFVLSNLLERDDRWNITAILYFNKRDNDEIPAIRMEKIAISQIEEDMIDDSSYTLYAYVDTNRLGEEFDTIQQKILFSGYLEISFLSKEPEENDVIYCFPVELLLNNTKNEDLRQCIPLQSKTVSIDFGTSSSCVAVEGENGIELLTLSAREEGNDDINIYENPTCVMLYRWEELYDQWRKENGNLPLLVRGDLDEEREGKKVQFDFGYSVKKKLHEVGDKELNAILTEIKMIPKILHEGNQTSIRPLRPQEKKVIEIVDSYEQQNEEQLDIVAFYGYLLGKAINRVEKNRIYTSYQITYPVKFNERVKNKMCASLQNGLRRSLPLPLRDAVDRRGKPIFKVDTKYPEPVAYIGSVCGKYLKLADKAELFAVYDFGGGTLDYSFGIFAPDPEDPMESNIYILGIDGDSTIGGELLIKRMSYWIYTSSMNLEAFVENKIPFEKPENEPLLDDCPEELFNKTASAKSNVRKMNERISRKIFEGKTEMETYSPNSSSEDSVGTTSGRRKKPVGESKTGMKIDFISLDEKTFPIEVSYMLVQINQRLRGILKDTVNNFKDSLKRTFESKMDVLRECGIKEFNIRDVHIFKAGNSSRNHILEELLREEFAENEILLVDETSSEFMGSFSDIADIKPKQLAITPKTAVALGQLKLGNFSVRDSYVRGDGKVFNWYIGAINRGNNQFKLIIDKANPSQEWVKYGRINSINMRIYFAETLIENADDTRLRSAELQDYLNDENIQNDLYLKVKDFNTILCCVCEKGMQPEGRAEAFEIEL